MRPDTITLAIFEKHTLEEMAATATKMAQAQSDLEGIEAEKKISDAGYNERIKKCAGDVSLLAKLYNKGGESAQIGCDIRYDHPEPGKKSYFRMDRNELVETHEMSWEERQETIQFPLAEAPAPTDEQVNAALDSLTEEVTRLCPFPNCKLFAEHEGDHDLGEPERKQDEPPTPEPPPNTLLETTPEERARTKREAKKRKSKEAPAILPDNRPQPPSGQAQP